MNKRFIVGLLCLFGLVATTLKAEKKIRYWVVIYAVRNHNRSERVSKKAKEQFNEKVEKVFKTPYWQVRIGVSTPNERDAVAQKAKGLGYWPRVYKAKIKIDDETAFKRQKKLELGQGNLFREIESSPQNRLQEIAQWLLWLVKNQISEKKELLYQLARSEKEKTGLVTVGEELIGKIGALDSIIQRYERLEFENEDLKKDLQQMTPFRKYCFILVSIVLLTFCAFVILGRFYLKLREAEKEVRDEKEGLKEENIKLTRKSLDDFKEIRDLKVKLKMLQDAEDNSDEVIIQED